MQAVAAPSVAQTAADRAAVDRAVARFEAARKRSADVAARVERTSAELDRVIAEEEAIRLRVETRAVALYRSDDTGYISVLFSTRSIQEFASMWDLLVRLDEQDAEDLVALEAARANAERSAKSLLTLQADAARAVDGTSAEVAAARKALASSAAALADYNARIAKAARAAKAAAARKKSAMQQRSGTGSWLNGLASHYSKDFSGRGASGAAITPYSMMVAHKTLPFHTLVEIEYNGRRCVASVEDRGPHSAARVFDLGPGVVRALGFSGVHKVRYRVIGR
jgi:rare lipoprotein A (peptidoglycan hydrolase)